MMEFFDRHDAVACGPAGIDWRSAPNDRLFRWAESECQAWDADPANHASLVDRMRDVRDELTRRIDAAWHKPRTDERCRNLARALQLVAQIKGRVGG